MGREEQEIASVAHSLEEMEEGKRNSVEAGGEGVPREAFVAAVAFHRSDTYV